MKFCPTILVAAILFFAALLTVCQASHNPIASGPPVSQTGPGGPEVAQNRRRRQAHNSNGGLRVSHGDGHIQ
jgi:hypothetical protein